MNSQNDSPERNSMKGPITLEVPCGNIESVHSAVEGGADRIELCSALPLGGFTPSLAMFENIYETNIQKFIMIRPREGDFVFSSKEFRTMLREIELFKEARADGIVSGVLMKSGEVDVERTRELIYASRPLPFTFHRAFDLTNDPFRSLDILIELKADRLLTSGQAPDAFTGRHLIAKLVRHSENKIAIMAGAGINADNVASICRDAGVSEVHLSGCMKKKSEMAIQNKSVFMGKPGNDEMDHEVTDLMIIKKVRTIIDG